MTECHKWSHKELSSIDGMVLTLQVGEIDSLPKLLRKKIGVIV